MSPEVPPSSEPSAGARGGPQDVRDRIPVSGSAVAIGPGTAGGTTRSRRSFGLVGTSVTPDVRMRQIRGIPEPLTGFIRFEYNVTAGRCTMHR